MEERAQGTRTGLLAVAGGAIFTITWFVLGLISDGYRMWDIVIDSYSPIAQPISGLGLGSTAPVMNTAFVVCGALISTGAWTAMSRWPGAGRGSVRWARALVAASGLGMAMCGIFHLESIMLHTLGFLIATAVPGVGFLVAARVLRGSARKLGMVPTTDRVTSPDDGRVASPDRGRVTSPDRGRQTSPDHDREIAYRRLAGLLRIAGPVTLAGVVAFMVTFNATDAGNNVGVAGLIQRILVTVTLIAVGAIGLSGLSIDRRDRVPVSENGR